MVGRTPTVAEHGDIDTETDDALDSVGSGTGPSGHASTAMSSLSAASDVSPCLWVGKCCSWTLYLPWVPCEWSVVAVCSC